jgi:hypothetical protein
MGAGEGADDGHRRRRHPRRKGLMTAASAGMLGQSERGRGKDVGACTCELVVVRRGDLYARRL